MEQDEQEKSLAADSENEPETQEEADTATAATNPEQTAPADSGALAETACGESDAVPVKKAFQFEKSIDELYDEGILTSIEPDEEQQSSLAEEDKPVKRKKHKWLNALIIIVLIMVVVSVLAAFSVSSIMDMTAISRDDNKVDVTIPAKASTSQIAKILKSDGVIDNPIAFQLYVKVKHISSLQHGTYTLNSDMPYSEIVYALKRVPAATQIVNVVIPEGKTLQWIGDTLEKKGVCTQQEFITALDKGGFQFPLTSQIPSNTDRFYKYEGYLFPDSYQFYKDSTGKSAAQKLLNNFTKKFDSSMINQAAKTNMSVDQVVTLASIIQAETGNVQQMGKVSSVFHNRLEKGVAEAGGKKILQSDATIFYATNDIQPVLQQSSTEIASKYNTYKNEGLPPGPICNPGLDAIHAALYPDNTDYFYFVSDNAGNYYYASTYSQHQKNVKKALKSSTAKGTDVYQ